MQAATYQKLTQSFREHPKLAKSVHICNRILTGLMFLSYPLLLLWLWHERAETLYLSIVVPLDGFLIISAFRCLVNRERPYERFGIAPVIPRRAKGKSFPSRHAFCASMVAVTYLVQDDPVLAAAGALLALCALALGGIRVVSGVHYLSDVLAAFVCAGIGGMAYILLC